MVVATSPETTLDTVAAKPTVAASFITLVGRAKGIRREPITDSMKEGGRP